MLYNKIWMFALPLLFNLLLSGVMYYWRLAYLLNVPKRLIPQKTWIHIASYSFWQDLLIIASIIPIFFLLFSFIKFKVANKDLRKKLKVGLYTFSYLFLIYFLFIRAADLIYFFYSGKHLDLMLFQHIAGSSFHVSKGLAFALGGLFLLIMICSFLLYFYFKTLNKFFRFKQSLVHLAVLFTCSGTAAYYFHNLSIKTPHGRGEFWIETVTTREAVSIFPEIEVWTNAIAPLLVQSKNYKAGDLPPILAKKLQSFGLQIDEKARLPFKKEKVFSKPHPFKKIKEGKPNFIILYFESLPADLMNVYGHPLPKLTPYFDEMSQISYVVEDFFNSSTPTFNGILSSLCSVYPTMHGLSDRKAIPNLPKLMCFPSIMGERGWDTVFIREISKKYASMDRMLSHIGFSTVLDMHDIQKLLKEKHKHWWGYSDHQNFRFLVEKLKRKDFKEPFMVSLTTVDTHVPFRLPSDGKAYKKNANKVINTVYNADHAFGVFWKYFKESPYFENTILMVMADHTLFPGKEHANARSQNITMRYYDRIPLIIYNPFHEMVGRKKVMSGQVDLLPSLLHLLDINVANSFEGQSIFEDRSKYTNLLGVHEFHLNINQLIKGKRVEDNFLLNHVMNQCDLDQVDHSQPHLTRCEYYMFYRWKMALRQQNRLWQ